MEEPGRDRFMSIGELAAHANVTVRTLQYYDQQGLLSPSAVDQNNHRLYRQKDVDELYHILLLKFLGLTLSEIKERKQSLEDVSDIRVLANARLQSIEQEISVLLKTMTQLRELIEYASLTMGSGQADWQDLADFLETKQDEPEMFWRLISVQDSTPSIDGEAEDEASRKVRIEQWHGLIAQTIRLMEGDIDPDSKQAFEMLERYIPLLSDFPEDGAMMPDFLLIGSEAMGGIAGSQFEGLSREVGSYLQAALKAHGPELDRMLTELDGKGCAANDDDKDDRTR